MTKVGELFIEIITGAPKARKDLRDLKKDGEEAGKSVERSFSGANRKVDNFNAGLQRSKRLFSLIAGAGAVGAVTKSISTFANADVGGRFAQSDIARSSQDQLTASRQNLEEIIASRGTTQDRLRQQHRANIENIRLKSASDRVTITNELTSGLNEFFSFLARQSTNVGGVLKNEGGIAPFVGRGLTSLGDFFDRSSGVSQRERIQQQTTGLTAREQRTKRGLQIAQNLERSQLALENARFNQVIAGTRDQFDGGFRADILARDIQERTTPNDSQSRQILERMLRSLESIDNAMRSGALPTAQPGVSVQ